MQRLGVLCVVLALHLLARFELLGQPGDLARQRIALHPQVLRLLLRSSEPLEARLGVAQHVVELGHSWQSLGAAVNLPHTARLGRFVCPMRAPSTGASVCKRAGKRWLRFGFSAKE